MERQRAKEGEVQEEGERREEEDRDHASHLATLKVA